MIASYTPEVPSCWILCYNGKRHKNTTGFLIKLCYLANVSQIFPFLTRWEQRADIKLCIDIFRVYVGIYPLWHLPSTSHTLGVSWVQAPLAIAAPFRGRELRWILCEHSRGTAPRCRVLSFQAGSRALCAGAGTSWRQGWPGAGSECLQRGTGAAQAVPIAPLIAVIG